MLLKSHFTFKPSDQYLDSFWPAVSERLDSGVEQDSPPNGGGIQSQDEGEIVFKSNSAMKILAIPERQEPEPAPEPSAAPPPDSHPWRWPLAFVLATVCVTGAFIYHKKTTPPPVQDALATHGTMGTIAATQEIRQDAAIKVAMATLMEAGTQGAAHDAGASPSTPQKAASHSKARRSKSRSSGKSASAKAKADTPDKATTASAQSPKPASKRAAPAGNRKPDELDNLINSALGGEKPESKTSADTPIPAASPDLPAQLTMNQIQQAMRKITGHVQSCYDKYQMEGLAKVTYTILPTGTLTGAAIKGKFFGTDTGACVVKAVKKAKFPKFSGKPMKIPNYPFRLQ